MNETTIILSYDLGIRGDYSGLFSYLDELNAKECGASTAAFNYTYKADPFSEIEESLRNSMTPNENTRIYILTKDPTTNKMRGKFIIGGRKKAPWTGYAAILKEVDEMF